VLSKNKELRESLGLEPVSLAIRQRKLTRFKHDEHEDDTDWMKHCTTMETEARGRHGV